MALSKEPKYSLKLQHKKVFEVGLILSLAIAIGLVMAFKRKNVVNFKEQAVKLQMIVEEIPVTEQIRRPPSPARPSIPIETESEEVPEDETIDITEIDYLRELVEPPILLDTTDPVVIDFIPYDEPPKPIGDFDAILKNLKYPEIARKAGVEGTVIVKITVDIKGNVVKTEIIQSLGNNGCDEAAIAAIKKVKWKPAMQRDRPVKVQIAVPIRFKLK